MRNKKWMTVPAYIISSTIILLSTSVLAEEDFESKKSACMSNCLKAPNVISKCDEAKQDSLGDKMIYCTGESGLKNKALVCQTLVCTKENLNEGDDNSS